MGGRLSKSSGGVELYGEDDDFMLSDINNIDVKNLNSENVPIEVLVAHYMPPTFPMIPVMNRRTHKKCNDSWSGCINKDVFDNQTKSMVSGLTAFYTEFYERLAVFDREGKFDAVLRAFSKKGQSKIAARGAIILRVVKSCLNIQSDTEVNRKMLLLLGKTHSKMGIRPWMYAIFVQTLLNTLSTRLGTNASADVMEAWVHLFAYVMKYMVPPAIKGNVDLRETYLTAAIFKNSNQDGHHDRDSSFVWRGGDNADDDNNSKRFFLATAAAAVFRSARGSAVGSSRPGSTSAPEMIMGTGTGDAGTAVPNKLPLTLTASSSSKNLLSSSGKNPFFRGNSQMRTASGLLGGQRVEGETAGRSSPPVSNRMPNSGSRLLLEKTVRGSAKHGVNTGGNKGSNCSSPINSVRNSNGGSSILANGGSNLMNGVTTTAGTTSVNASSIPPIIGGEINSEMGLSLDQIPSAKIVDKGSGGAATNSGGANASSLRIHAGK